MKDRYLILVREGFVGFDVEEFEKELNEHLSWKAFVVRLANFLDMDPDIVKIIKLNK